MLKRGGAKASGGPKLRKKENVYDKAKMQRGLAKAKLVSKLQTPDEPVGLMDNFPTGYIIVFDIGDVKSHKEAERQLDRLCAPPLVEDPFYKVKHVVLCGNKTDKSRRYRRITYEEGVKLSQKYPDVPYFETSAKLYQKVDKAFLTVVKKVQTSMASSFVDTVSSASGGGASGGAGDPGGAAATSGAGGSSGDLEENADPNEAIKGAAGDEDIKEGNVIYNNCCCPCCPKKLRKCCKKCTKRCSIM